MDPLAGVVLGAGLLGLAILLIVVTVRGKRKNARLARDAGRRGWAFTPGPAPVVSTIAGTVDGVAFQATSRRPAGLLGDNRGAVPTVTEVTVAAPALAGGVILRPARADGAGAGLAEALLAGPFRAQVMGDRAAAITGLTDATDAIGTAAPRDTAVEATSP